MPSTKRLLATIALAAAALALVACGGDSEVAPTPTLPVAGPPTPTPDPSTFPTSAVTVALGDGTVARYMVREQLARQSLPRDAIGETTAVFGWITFNPDGTVKSDDSTITVDLASITSDESQRDSYVRDNTLQTDEFPNAVFVAKDTRGLPWPLPQQGEATFRLIGDLTIHGVTRGITWQVTAQFDGQTVTATATTSFPFDEFEMERPNVLFIVGVENEIKLELDMVASVG